MSEETKTPDDKSKSPEIIIIRERTETFSNFIGDAINKAEESLPVQKPIIDTGTTFQTHSRIDDTNKNKD